MDEQIISTPTPVKPHVVTGAVKSPLFLTVAILMSISVGIKAITALSANNLSVDIIGLLIMIGMWIAYVNASKTPKEQAIPANGLNMISGTVKAMRIISLVVSIIFIVCSLILILLGVVINQNEAIYHNFRTGYLEGIGSQSLLVGGKVIYDFRDLIATPEAAMRCLIGIGVVLMFVAIVILVVYYFLFLKTLHRFTYSVCENVKNGTPIEKANSVWVWLLVLGIISAVFSLDNLLVNGPSVAAQIISAVLILNNFCN